MCFVILSIPLNPFCLSKKHSFINKYYEKKGI